MKLHTLLHAPRPNPRQRHRPRAVLRSILSNPTDLELAQKLTTDDFTYVSLNYEHADLRKVMPWAGTNKGAKGMVQTFIDVGRYWTTDTFRIQDSFENNNGAAIFGYFTYTSKVLRKMVTSPFAVLARGGNGKLSYVQFMEYTFATARTFREGGEYIINANPEGSEINV